MHPKGQSTQVKVGTYLCTCRTQTKVSALQIQVEFRINIFTTKLLHTLYYVALAELKVFKASACVISKPHNLWSLINLLPMCQVPHCKAGSSRQVLSLCWIVWRKQRSTGTVERSLKRKSLKKNSQERFFSRRI